MSELALVGGYALIVVYLFYLSFDLMGKPNNGVERSVLKWLQPKHIAIFIRILAMWSVVGGMALLLLIATGTVYEPFFESIFVTGVWSMIGITLIYLYLYFMFQITEKMQEAGKMRYKL